MVAHISIYGHLRLSKVGLEKLRPKTVELPNFKCAVLAGFLQHYVQHVHVTCQLVTLRTSASLRGAGTSFFKFKGGIVPFCTKML